MKPRERILFFAESVTLSQVTRLVMLARALDPARYELHFASADFPDLLFAGAPWVRHRVHSIDPVEMLRALRGGRRIYEERTLVRYAEDDLRVLDAVRPSLVVSDFRLSLSVSARVAGVRHAALINAYFSPYGVRDGFPMPDHPIVDLLGPERAAPYFPRALPMVFAHFVEPMQALRRRHGIAPSGSLLEVLTDADHVLYPDTPALVPTAALPAHHEYLGPVIWSAPAPLPSFWERLPPERPVVYVTLGSSGNLDALPAVVRALGSLDVSVVLATAGRAVGIGDGSNLFVEKFLPGDVVSRRAAVVVSNGGSSTSYQALAEGTPVVGIPSNFDQYLAMTAIENVGAGKLVRAGTVTEGSVTGAVRHVLDEPAHRRAAERIQRDFATHDAGARFADFVERAVAAPPLPSRPGASPRRGLRAWFASLAVLACAFTAQGVHAEAKAKPKPSRPAAAPAAPPVTGEIRFTTDTKSSKGKVICALFRSAGWLKKPIQHVKADIKDKQAECVFAGVPAGVFYAIIAFHDANDNGDIDKNFLGIPTEDWCASRDASGFMGPPQFDHAKFPFSGGVLRLRAPM